MSARNYSPPSLRLSAEVQLVQLEAVVRDARGHAVAGLGQNDFEILEEGKPRAIAAFSVETRPGLRDTPTAAGAPPSSAPLAGSRNGAAATTPPNRSVMLFFDDLHAQAGEFRRVQNAALHFVRHNLTPGMRAAVFTSSDGLALDFTEDAGQLAAAIDKLRAHPRVSENGLAPCPRIPPYQAYLIFYGIDPNAVVAAVSEAHACDSADSSISNVYAGNGPGPGTTSKLGPAGPRIRSR